MKRVLACLFSVALPVLGHAGPYQFGGGACASQGNFTRDAFNQAASIRQSLEALRDVPACKALYNTALPMIEAASRELQATGPGGESAQNQAFQRMMSLPSEISALRRFAVASPAMRQDVLKLLVDRSFQQAQLAANDKLAPGLPNGDALSAIANRIGPLAERSMNAARTGVSALTRLMPALADSQECIVGSNGAGMALFAASVQALATFATNDSGLGNQLSAAVASMGEMVRRKEISDALRRLNKTEFWASASCLLETTTENYCQTLDQRTLLQTELNEMVRVRNATNTDARHPLSGMYVMLRDVPAATAWLRDILSGVEPRWLEDSARMQKVVSTQAQTTNTALTLKATFNQNATIIRSLPPPPSKARRLRTAELVQTLVQALSGGGGGGFPGPGLGGAGGGASGGQENFFMTSVPMLRLPFYLIGYTGGVDGVPTKCLPGGMTTALMDPITWMQTDSEADSYFNDTEALLRTISMKLDDIVDSAFRQVTVYFIQQMSIDPKQLVAKTIVGPGVTVKMSLNNMRNYLASLYATLKDDPTQTAEILDFVRSTYHRIDRVLRAYDALAAALPGGLNDGENTLAADAESEKKYRDFIEAAFANFNMLLQLDTFFQRRLSTLVQHDLSRRSKQGLNLSAYERDLMLASGDDLVNRMLRIMGQDPAHAKMDLEGALVVGKNNIAVMEQFFEPRLYPIMDELLLVSSGKPVTPQALDERTRARALRDYYVYSRESHLDGELKRINPIRFLSYQMPWIGFKSRNPDLYPFYFPFRGAGAFLNPEPYTPLTEDRFGSFEQVLARLCSQSLAFSDPLKSYWEYCKGRSLKSPLEEYRKVADPSSRSLDLHFNDYVDLSRQYPFNTMRNPYQQTPERRDAAICALHNYRIKNQVYSMMMESKNQQEQQQQHQPSVPPPPLSTLNDARSTAPGMPAIPQAQPAAPAPVP